MENATHGPATPQVNMRAGDGSVVVHTLLGSVVLVNETPTNHSIALKSYIDALARFVATPYRALNVDVPLNDVYVPLRASRKDRSELASTSVSEVFRNHHPDKPISILLEGAPGSGKSTIIWHVTQKCYSDPSAVGLPRKYLPLLVRLHCFARASGDSIEARLWAAVCLADDIVPEIEAPTGYLTAWPNSTQTPWLFLLDGYDEVPADQRRKVNELLRYLTEKGQNVFLTSRPLSGIPKRIEDCLDRYVAEPLDDNQFSAMAGLWLGPKTASFVSAYSECSLRQIEQTPLVVTMALSVYSRNDHLPTNRPALYSEYLSIAWEEARARGLEDELRAASPDIIPLASSCLDQLAYHSTRLWKGTAEIARGSELRELRTSLSAFLARQTGKGSQIALELTDRFLEIAGRRSGVFTYRDRYCEWLHPSFREHLSARVLAESLTTGSSPAPELDLWRENEWRYVVLFGLALASEVRDIDALTGNILSEGGEGHRFVGEIIVEGGRLTRKRRMEVYRALSKDVLDAARMGVCAGLLSTPDGELALPVFSRLSTMPEFRQSYQETLKAIGDIIKRDSRSYGPLILGKLKATSVLKDIAADSSVLFESRLRCLEQVERSGSEALVLAMIREESVTDGPRILKLLRETIPDVSMEDIAKDATVSHIVRCAVPELLLEGGDRVGLRNLADDLNVEASVRAIATAVLAESPTSDTSGDPGTELSNLSSDPQTAITVLTRLAEKGLWEQIGKLCHDKGSLSPDIVEVLFGLLNRKWQHQMMLDILSSRQIATPLRARLLASVSPDETTARQFVPIDTELDSFGRAYPEGAFSFLKWRASFLFARQEFDRALPLFEAVLKREADSEFALQSCGTAHLALNHFDEASKLLVRASELRSFDPYPLRLAGLAHLFAGRFGEAADAFAASVQRNFLPPSDDELWYLAHFADACYRSGRFMDGLECLSPHDSFVSGRPELLFLQGRLFAAAGLFNRAIQAFEATREAMGDDPAVIQEIIICLRCMGCNEEAARNAESLAKNGPQPSPMWFTVAELSLGMRDLGRAAEALELVRNEWGSDPYFCYLDAYLSFARGDSIAARDKAAGGLMIIASTSDEMDSLLRRNNSGLLGLLAGDDGLGWRSFEDLVADETILNAYSVSARVHLRLYSLPALRDLSKIMPENEVNRSLIARLNTLLRPIVEDGQNVPTISAPETSTLRGKFFEGMARQGYPFPMYCRRNAIGGLYDDKKRAEAVLAWYSKDIPIICLWRLDQSDRVYGHCNFEREAGDGSHFKFCDAIPTVINSSLEILVSDHGVEKLLFVEPDLLHLFDLAIREIDMLVRCELIPDEHLSERPVSTDDF